MTRQPHCSIISVSVLAALALGGCAGQAVGFGGAVTQATPVLDQVPDSECPSAVSVKVIPPLHGMGYSWVRAAYEGGGASAPTWTISRGADIRADQDEEHGPFYAMIMAPTGRYKVSATGPCGIVGEATIDHVITEP